MFKTHHVRIVWRKKMSWISLKKESPRLGEWVLALTTGQGIYQIRRIGSVCPLGYDSLDYMIPASVRDDVVFTHWMPVPEMPHDLE